MTRVMAALGGNALLERGESPDADAQERRVRSAVHALVPIALEHELIVTHGNGPQVGLLALESAQDRSLTKPYPLDVLGAQTQGMIGYWLMQTFQNALPGREVAGLITQTLVSAADPAFRNPTKFVGPVYDEPDSSPAGAGEGWTMKRDGNHWRRVVPSPAPQRIIEVRLIRRLLESGTLVICAGGGGVPVIRNAEGLLEGVEAVVDKDATAALLAEALDVDVLLMLTDVQQVSLDYGTDEERPIHRATPTSLRRLDLPGGSMGPKVAAACQFVEMTDGTAAIGALADTEEILAGRAGTIVTPTGRYLGDSSDAMREAG